ncbi:MAG: hypothetical protein D6781_07595 [Verrucomicrobia bacterium]|nr:MAG: hypothetical protein D6781_07595 [Verrucomicrobiota bacterium]
MIGNELVSPTVPFVVVDGSSTGVYVHGNNEGGTVQWRAGEPQVVPASYLYETTPAFWNIPDPWPSIGPEHEAGQYTIPAQRRWEQGLVETFAAPLPEIEAQPVSAAAAPGGVVTLSADVYTLGPVSYQWQKDGVDLTDGASLSGANTATLTIQNVSPADAGVYRLVITGDRGTVTTAEALVSVWDPAAGHLANLSTRGQVLAGDDILIAGFVLDGAGTKTLLIRGLGPAMIKFVGEEKALADATLTLNAGARSLGSNDDWSLAEVGDLALWLGAFPITPGSKDAALRADLEAGSYTAHLAGAGGTGVALLELYVDAPAAEPRLMNISTRGHVGTGDAVMIPGIVVADSPMRLLVRGVGPELAVSFGFDSGAVLADPVLTLFDKDGRPIEVSDNWGDQTEAFTLAAVAEQVGAFALTPESLDAAILVEVEPGSYTAQVADAGGGEGIAIVEVYAAP